MKYQAYIEQEERTIHAALLDALTLLPCSSREVAEYVLFSGGKRLRPLLLLLFAKHFRCTKEEVYQLAVSLELIHSATLLHDDIIDHSIMRRGKKSAHLRYGTTKTILAGDALLALGCCLVSERGVPRLLTSVSTMIVKTVEGEILEIDAEGQAIGIEKHIGILRGKTGFMVRTACEMGAIFADASQEDVMLACNYGESLGIAFQIMDDILDYSPSSVIGKPQGLDIAEGKITIPLLCYLDTLSAEERKAFLVPFLKKQFSEVDKKRIINNIVQSGALDMAITFVQKYVADALESIEKFEETLEKEVLLELAHFVLQRTH